MQLQREVLEIEWRLLPHCRICAWPMAPTPIKARERFELFGFEWCDCSDCYYTIRDSCECGNNTCLKR